MCGYKKVKQDSYDGQAVQCIDCGAVYIGDKFRRTSHTHTHTHTRLSKTEKNQNKISGLYQCQYPVIPVVQNVTIVKIGQKVQNLPILFLANVCVSIIIPKIILIIFKTLI